jgi:hypothetical protein
LALGLFSPLYSLRTLSLAVMRIVDSPAVIQTVEEGPENGLKATISDPRGDFLYFLAKSVFSALLSVFI